jgi:hypothetical protein
MEIVTSILRQFEDGNSDQYSQTVWGIFFFLNSILFASCIYIYSTNWCKDWVLLLGEVVVRVRSLVG